MRIDTSGQLDLLSLLVSVLLSWPSLCSVTWWGSLLWSVVVWPVASCQGHLVGADQQWTQVTLLYIFWKDTNMVITCQCEGICWKQWQRHSCSHQPRQCVVKVTWITNYRCYWSFSPAALVQWFSYWKCVYLCTQEHVHPTHLVCEVEVRVHLDHLPAAVTVLIDAYQEAGVILLPPLNVKVSCLWMAWNHVPVHTQTHIEIHLSGHSSLSDWVDSCRSNIKCMCH